MFFHIKTERTSDLSNMPPVDSIRKRIESVDTEEARFCLMAEYLLCARISEIVGITSPSDLGKTLARGPKGTEVKLDVFELGPIREEAAIFTVYTAKRGGIERKIAIPLNPVYEPWTRELYNYFVKHGNNRVFPFTRQKAYKYAQEAFEDLTYPIEPYRVGGDKVKRHFRKFRTHALRHARATELIEFYGFDHFDLCVYGGWTMKSAMGVGSLSRYAHLQWRKYFPKMLKKRLDF